MDAGRTAQDRARMQMLLAGLAVWSAGSVLLALAWVTAAHGYTLRTRAARVTVVLPAPRPQTLDLTTPPAVAPASAEPEPALPRAAL